MLGSDRLPTETAAIDYLVCPVNAEAEVAAFRHAQQLRQTHPDRRIELDLGGRSPEEIGSYGQQMGIGEIVWINPDGTIG